MSPPRGFDPKPKPAEYPTSERARSFCLTLTWWKGCSSSAPERKGAVTANPETLLLRDAEAAALCSFGRSTWHRLVARGAVPPGLKIGRARRWRRGELLDWLEDGASDVWTW